MPPDQQQRELERQQPLRAPQRPVPERTEDVSGATFAADQQDRVGNRRMLEGMHDQGDWGQEVRRGLGLMHLARNTASASQRVDPNTGDTGGQAQEQATAAAAARQRQDETVLTAITDVLAEYQSVSVNVDVQATPAKKGEEPITATTQVDLKVPYRINGAGNREYAVGESGYPSGRLPKGDDADEQEALRQAKQGKATAAQYQTAVQDLSDSGMGAVKAGKGWMKDGELTPAGKKGAEDELRRQLQYTDAQGQKSQVMGVDCSGFVYEIIRRVQRQNKYEDATFNDNGGKNNVGTATMLADKKNFKPVEDSREVRAGDLVLQPGHVEMTMGNQQISRDEAVRYGLPTDAVQPMAPPRKKGEKGPAQAPVAPEVRLVHVAESQPGRANFDKRTKDRYGPDVDQYLIVRNVDGSEQWYQQKGENEKDPSKRVWVPAERSVRRVNLGFPKTPAQ